MEKDFWYEKWVNQDTAFHQMEGNHLFLKYFPTLNLPRNSKVFLPLCGKSYDMSWLVQQGYQVIGVELVEQAVKEYFEENKVTPDISKDSGFKVYQAPNLKILVGDFFDLSQKALGNLDLIYDRAALVALPEEMRKRYTQHLRTITQCPQLLITFDYDQSKMPGPPFSVNSQEIQEHYQSHYDIKLLESVEIDGGLKRTTAATENIWKLSTKTNS